MKRITVDYDHKSPAKSDELWKTWLSEKENLHLDTMEEILIQWKEGRCSLVLNEPPVLEADAYLYLEVRVRFDAQKAEPITKDYPGCPAEIEINEIRIREAILPQAVFDEVMEQCSDTLEDACWEILKGSARL